MTIRNLTNVSSSDVTLNDMNGLTIAVNETVDGLMFGETTLKSSADVLEALLNGLLTVSDGSMIYERQRGVDLIKDTVFQYTKDGKRIYTASDRPQDHYRYFTTCGDNLTTRVRGDGECLEYAVAPGEEQAIDIQFIDDVYLKDGSMIYHDAEMGSRLRVEIWVPAGLPYPSKGDGNFDYVNGSFVPNSTNTGKYWIRDVETMVHRFINQMSMFGMGRQYEKIDTSEPNFIPKEWIIRLTVINAPLDKTDKTIRATITLGLYRKQTF